MYELLAIKELIENGLINSKNVSPIIEPVRDNSTFNNLLKLAKKNDYNLNIISNPQVGEYKAVDQLPGLIKVNNMKNSIIIQNNNTVTISKDDLLFYDAPVEVLDDSNRNSTINVVQDSLVFNKSRIAMENLKKVGMDPFIKAKPQQLSGGQQQRVAIARDRKSTRLNSSHNRESRMPSSA